MHRHNLRTDNPLLKVPPASRGNRIGRGRGLVPLREATQPKSPIGSPREAGRAEPCAVPLAKRGEPEGGG